MLIFNTDSSKECLFTEESRLIPDALPLKNIIQFAEMHALTPYIMKEYIITMLIEDINVLSQICETGETVGDSLKAAALNDLTKLWSVLSADVLYGYVPSIKRELPFTQYQLSVLELVRSVTPKELLDRLILHYRTFGGGKISKYIAFRWDHGLNGVKNPDDITMERLFCLDSQKKILEDNTVSFIEGLPANNVLLFGNRGSGKSSMIKALLNKYYRDGLRLIEISKSALSDLPTLIDYVKDKKFKYIIFIDDLSFESNETGYKHLKVIIDGQIEKRPSNVLFYATSNRRHLINETWSERQGDEVHVNDTKNEKLSLAERFGISVYFSSPDQREYFEIIEGILSKENIAMTDEIKARAIKWELNYNGRSGRTAMQFARMIVAGK